MNPTLTGVDKRLQQRYQRLVHEHTGQAQPTAPGPRLLPTTAQAKAHAQAAWRFFHNRHLSWPQLMQPLLHLARQQSEAACDAYGLVVHDWSRLDYCRHTAKQDRIVLDRYATLGYERYTALLLGDQDGRPLAPLRLRLRSPDGIADSGRRRWRRTPQTHLDGLIVLLEQLRRLDLARPLVHIIDAEGDSVYHLRRWHRDGHLFVVRTDEQRVVRYQGGTWPLPEVAQRLRQRDALTYCRPVSYQGRRAWP